MTWQSQHGDGFSYQPSDGTYLNDSYYIWPRYPSSHGGLSPSTSFGPRHFRINSDSIPYGSGSSCDTRRGSWCAFLTIELLPNWNADPIIAADRDTHACPVMALAAVALRFLPQAHIDQKDTRETTQ